MRGSGPHMRAAPATLSERNTNPVFSMFSTAVAGALPSSALDLRSPLAAGADNAMHPRPDSTDERAVAESLRSITSARAFVANQRAVTEFWHQFTYNDPTVRGSFASRQRACGRSAIIAMLMFPTILPWALLAYARWGSAGVVVADSTGVLHRVRLEKTAVIYWWGGMIMFINISALLSHVWLTLYDLTTEHQLAHTGGPLTLGDTTLISRP